MLGGKLEVHNGKSPKSLWFCNYSFLFKENKILQGKMLSIVQSVTAAVLFECPLESGTRGNRLSLDSLPT